VIAFGGFLSKVSGAIAATGLPLALRQRATPLLGVADLEVAFPLIALLRSELLKRLEDGEDCELASLSD
jgi:hypothetical protein